MIASSTRSAPIARIVRALFAPIDPSLRGDRTDPVAPVSMGWIAVLCLGVSVGSLVVVLGHAAGLRSSPYAPVIFWPGVTLMLLPILRIGDLAVARGERIFLLVLVG